VGNVDLELRRVQRRPVEGARMVAPEELDRRLAEEADRSLRHGRSLAVLVVEVPVGEAAAVEPALLTGLRALDLVTRSAPGRFLVLLGECGAAEALAAAQRLGGALARVAPGARLGLAGFPGDAPSVEAVVRAAQLAVRPVTDPAIGVARQAVRRLRLGGREVILAEPAMLRLYGMVERLASAAMPVLVTGETGTGKEVVAEALHFFGSRAHRPLTKINCAAVPESLLEAELFGHERGAFTGAVAARPGLIEQTAGGTLFLDEVSEMSPALQSKLLRALEDRRLRRLGAVRERAVDVRFVAATHRDLVREVDAGRFRADLFYRLDAMTLAVPPLRERRREILPLAEHFAAEAAREAGRELALLDPALAAALERHSWPGNVRELHNVIRRAVVLADGRPLTPAHLPASIDATAPAPPAVSLRALAAQGITLDGALSLEEEIRALERARIVAALEACGGNQTRAAARLAMPRRTLVSKLAALGIDRPGRGRRAASSSGGQDPRPKPADKS
jgi:two-component system response regulator AtoC